MKKQQEKSQPGAGLKYGVFGAVALLLAVMVGFKLIPQNQADLVAEGSAEKPSRAKTIDSKSSANHHLLGSSFQNGNLWNNSIWNRHSQAIKAKP